MSDLQSILAEAREWLAAQPAPAHQSATWSGLNNLRAFLDQIEADPSRSGLERACHALGWHISDQYGAYDELPSVAVFHNRVRGLAKELEWQEFKASPSYKPLT